MMGSKALLFVPESDLAGLKKTLHDDLPFIQKFTQATNLVSLFETVNTTFRTAPHEANAQTESLVQSLPALTSIISQATDSLNRPGTPPSPGVTALFSAGGDTESQSYITFNHGKIFLVTAHAPSDEKNGDAVKRLRALVAGTRNEVPGLNIGITGEPVLELDEMAQSQRDTTVASIVSLVLCALIFIYGYNETGRPVKATTRPAAVSPSHAPSTGQNASSSTSRGSSAEASTSSVARRFSDRCSPVSGARPHKAAQISRKSP